MKTATIQQNDQFRVIAIPVLSDNFVYLVCHDQNAILIDAGEATPVLKILEGEKLRLRHILITHRHGDHIAGLQALQSHVVDSDANAVDPYQTLELPGHTDHDLGFYFPGANVVFTGDCLINGACGRPMTGSIESLFKSLQTIKQLPPDTLICGGHDYLVDNMAFARQSTPLLTSAIEQRLQQYATDQAKAIFQPLHQEWATNPFLQAETFDEFRQQREAKNRFG